MNISPPTENETTAQNLGRGYLTLLALFLALFCGWQLSSLPGSMIRKYEPPYDMPWHGYGIKQVAVDEDGVWHITRLGYADRSTYYVIKPGLHPEKHYHVPTELYKVDQSGSLSQQSVEFAGGQLAIKASRQYWAWRWRLKNMASTKRERREAYAADGSADVVGPALPMEPNAKLILAVPERKEFHVLEGHQYYPVLDGAAAVTPHVWVTTERGRNLHRLVFRNNPGDQWFEAVQSRPTRLEQPLKHSTTIGYLADETRVFMLLPSGRVDYYDSLTLEHLGGEQLAGDWRREYGELLHFGPTYSFFQGQPLAEGGYNRIMRGLMLVFLLSLLAIAVSWSKQWISTSDRTTGDTTPSSN